MSQIRMTELHKLLYMRGHTRGVNTSNLINELANKHIHMVMNVALIKDEELEGGLHVQGMEYIHEPLRDSYLQPLDAETIKALVRTVVATIRHGSGVLVHCDSGRNRSALVAIPALAEISGRSTAEVLKEVREKRPISRGVLDNPRFRKFVLNWEPLNPPTKDIIDFAAAQMLNTIREGK